MKRYCILVIFGLLSWSLNGQAADPGQLAGEIPGVWTAERAVAFALAGNPDSAIARKRMEEAMAAASIAKAADYPLVNVATEYGQTNNPMHSFGNVLNQGAFSDRIDFNNPGRTDNLQLKAEINYRLYNGGRDLAEQTAANATIDISRGDLVAVQQQLAFEVVKTFQAIIQAERMVTVREEALASITAALHVGQARFDAGDLLRQDLLNLELQQSLASENLIQSRHALELTRRSFLSLLGLQAGQIVIDPDGDPEQQLPATFGYQNRHELKKLEAVEQAARAELRKAYGGKLPSVDAFASYQLDSGSVLGGSGDSWMAGIRMNYTIFDGRKNDAQIAVARLKVQEIQEMRKKTELALNLEVQQAVLDYEQAEKRLTVTDKMAGVATEVIRLGRARFNEGVILAADLIDLEMRLADAQARQLAARAGYRVAIANLRRATGLEQFSMR